MRETTLTPLILDLSRIVNNQCAKGLYNAVSLCKEDCKLPPIRLDNIGRDFCPLGGMRQRRVVFVDELRKEGS